MYIYECSLFFSATVNVLIVGAGGLGLWTVKVAQALIGTHGNKVRVTVADNSVSKYDDIEIFIEK